MLNQTILNIISDGVITTDTLGKIKSMNRAAEQLTRWYSSEVMGISIEKVFRCENMVTREKLSHFVMNMGNELVASNHEVLLTDKYGGARPVGLRATPLQSEHGRQIGTAIVFTDLSDKSNLQNELKYQTTHDNLTHLLNRREFERRLQLSITSARRLQHEHVLCYLDLNQFKVINETCGHVAGDELLRQVAKLFQNIVRSGDTIARIGGDEFGLLLEHCEPEQAERVISQLIEATDNYRFFWDGRSFSMSVSIGLVSIDSTTSSIVTALNDANSACYLAKEDGRNKFHLYNANETQLVEHREELQWVDRIDGALERDEFVLYIQRIEPISSSTNGLHFEVLLRMRDKDGDLIAPGTFLPAAERYCLITKIDQWVVSQTLAWLSNNPAVISSLEMCSVNLSGQSLGDASFLSFIIDQLDEYDVPARLLCFEITETAAIANLSNAMMLINTLKKRGCLLALDDFGSGLSSFGYLKNLPVDFLKIDGQFVKDIMDDALDFAMVRSINEIGQLMGMRTIAEFVENDAVKSRLQTLGVDYVQGYGVEKPMAIDMLKEACNA